MQAAIDETYERFGRYLSPDITASPILMGGSLKYTPRPGRCSRTGVEGMVVDHKKGEGGIVPTCPKLLWMIAYQRRMNRTDRREISYRFTAGCVIFLPDEIISTIELTAPIPGLRVVDTTKAAVRAVLGKPRYLFVAFGKNIDRVFGNGLRYSCGSYLEVNGEGRFSGLDIINQGLDFTLPQQVAAMNLPDWDSVWRYYNLRNRESLTTEEQAEVLELRKGFGEHGAAMVRLSRQLSRQDLRLAKWLATP